MYSTCLFCNASLGANESIERFPVGRRLAYDAAKGRLWVVCKKCERWNLTPLESRWEAIEEAERAFHNTKLRVSTDNIGLAQLREGTELVRIGAPPKIELAAWRYGDQFGKRQRKFVRRAAIGGTGGWLLANFVMSSVAVFAAPVPALIGAGAFAAGIGAYFVHLTKETRLPHHAIRDQLGELRRFSVFNAQRATLSPAGHAFEWQLRLPYQRVQKTSTLMRAFGIREMGTGDDHSVVLRDVAAIRALSRLLPHANLIGGGKRALAGAVQVVNDAPNVQYILHKASVASPAMPYLQPALPAGEVAISTLPAALRLALEMSLHETDERRAMEGELHELENRWKEADAIAKIADAMFLPENIENTLREFRQDENKTEPSE